MEVHDRLNQLLSSLATPSAPALQGDNIGIVGRLMLTTENVPPLVTDEDGNLTDHDVEGSMDEGEDWKVFKTITISGVSDQRFVFVSLVGMCE